MNPNGNIATLTPFPKGVTGNPDGRPKGSYSLSTVIRKWLSMEHGDLKLPDGRVIRISKQDEAIRVQIKKAIEEHDTYALKTVLEFAYGKAKEHIEFNNVTEFLNEEEKKRDLDNWFAEKYLEISQRSDEVLAESQTILSNNITEVSENHGEVSV